MAAERLPATESDEARFKNLRSASTMSEPDKRNAWERRDHWATIGCVPDVDENEAKIKAERIRSGSKAMGALKSAE